MWGLRLGWYLTARKLDDPEEDRRYAVMREQRGQRFVLWSLVAIFGLQGLLVLVVSLPVQVGAERPAQLTAAVIPGVVLLAVGLGFEAIGDEQLRRFKADPVNQGKVMDSRPVALHPAPELLRRLLRVVGPLAGGAAGGRGPGGRRSARW